MNREKSRLTTHHILIAAAAFSIYLFGIGIGNNRASLFLIPVTEELGVSRSAYSLIASIAALCATFGNMFFGPLYHKLGYRRLAVLALGTAALGYFVFSRARAIWVFYVMSLFTGFAEAYYSNAGVSRLVTSWFNKRRGLVLGIVLASSGIGGAVFSAILASSIRRSGWRGAYLLCAGCLAVLLIPIALIVRSRPEEMGLEPYGGKDASVADNRRVRADWKGVPLRVIRRHPSLYLVLLATLLFAACNSGIYPYFVAHMQDQGLSQSFAATVQGIMFAAMAAAKLLEGALTDRFGVKKVLIVSVILGALGLFFLAEVRSQTMAILTLAIYSASLGAPAVLLSTVTMQMFGQHDYDGVMGLLFSMNTLAGVATGPLVNLIYDRVGTYTGVIYVLAGVCILVLVLYLLAFRSAAKLRRSWESEN